ncbi:unnamed protein product [Closterium sp. NIES-64]|nr:unnamed protein product [Closterium sp. NIES-64]
MDGCGTREVLPGITQNQLQQSTQLLLRQQEQQQQQQQPLVQNSFLAHLLQRGSSASFNPSPCVPASAAFAAEPTAAPPGLVTTGVDVGTGSGTRTGVEAADFFSVPAAPQPVYDVHGTHQQQGYVIHQDFQQQQVEQQQQQQQQQQALQAWAGLGSGDFRGSASNVHTLGLFPHAQSALPPNGPAHGATFPPSTPLASPAPAAFLPAQNALPAALTPSGAHTVFPALVVHSPAHPAAHPPAHLPAELPAAGARTSLAPSRPPVPDMGHAVGQGEWEVGESIGGGWSHDRPEEPLAKRARGTACEGLVRAGGMGEGLGRLEMVRKWSGGLGKKSEQVASVADDFKAGEVSWEESSGENSDLEEPVEVFRGGLQQQQQQQHHQFPFFADFQGTYNQEQQQLAFQSSPSSQLLQQQLGGEMNMQQSGFPPVPRSGMVGRGGPKQPRSVAERKRRNGISVRLQQLKQVLPQGQSRMTMEAVLGQALELISELKGQVQVLEADKASLGVSREEMVYQATQRADVSGIKRLRQEGVGLEWRDSHGRTSLIIACSRADMLPVARLLLQLGADVNAYVRGAQGGTAIHQAARKGLDQTVQLLLDYGADPLRTNDIGRRALDIAWEQHRPTMARIIENRVALYVGFVRQQQLSGPAFLQALVPQWVSKKVWVAVVPGSQGTNARQRLNIYASPSAPTATEVLLHHCRVYLTKQDTHDPVLVIEDMQRAEKYKFSADKDSREPGQMQKLYNACQGIPQRQVRPPSGQQQQQGSQRDSSRQSAAGSGPSATAGSDMGGWDAAPPPPTAYGGWDSGPSTSNHPHPFSPAAAAAAATAASATVGASVSTGSRSGDRSMGSSVGDGAGAGTGAGAGAGAGTAAGVGASDWGSSSSNADSFGGWGPANESPAPNRAPPPQTASAAPPATPAAASAAAAAAAASAAPVLVQQGQYQPLPVATASSAPIPMPSPRAAADTAPSAPPLSPTLATSPLAYPSIDTTPVLVDYGLPASAVAVAETAAGAAGAAGAAAAPPASPKVELHPSYDPARVQAELKRAESNVGTGGGQCVICWDAQAEAVCVPCGHVAGCMECLGEVKGKGWGCPVCRAEIQQVVKLFHV